MKAYLASKVWANLTLLDQYAATYQSGPVQTLFPDRRPEDGVPQYQPFMWISLWEQAYLAWAVDRVMDHGPVTTYNLRMAARRFAIGSRAAACAVHDAQWPRIGNGRRRTCSRLARGDQHQADLFPDLLGGRSRDLLGSDGGEARLREAIRGLLRPRGAPAVEDHRKTRRTPARSIRSPR